MFDQTILGQVTALGQAVYGFIDFHIHMTLVHKLSHLVLELNCQGNMLETYPHVLLGGVSFFVEERGTEVIVFDIHRWQIVHLGLTPQRSRGFSMSAWML